MDFIKQVLEFKTENLPKNIKDYVRKNYLDNPLWDVTKIGFSSKAAEPLAQWISSQLSYSDILLEVEPLAMQSKQLKEEGEQLNAKKKELDEQVKILMDKIVAF